MPGTLWVHDTIDTGRAGLVALATEVGCAAATLPPPTQRAAWPDVAQADPMPCGALLAVRGEQDVELLAKLRALHPALPILALGVGADREDCEDLVNAGAAGALPWESDHGRLTTALLAVLAGNTVLPPREQTQVQAAGGRFTDQEIGWLRQLERHVPVDDLATEACVAPRTMHRHLRHLYAKLGATDRASALKAAHRRHLL